MHAHKRTLWLIFIAYNDHMYIPLFSSAAALFPWWQFSFILANKSTTHKLSTVTNTVKVFTPLVLTTGHVWVVILLDHQLPFANGKMTLYCMYISVCLSNCLFRR